MIVISLMTLKRTKTIMSERDLWQIHNAYLEIKALLSDPKPLPRLRDIQELITETFQAGDKLLIGGNGGSAEQAMHFTSELVNKYYAKNRKPLPAIDLCSNAATVTAIANDFGYDSVLSRQIEALGKEEDTLILFTTSGKSTNIIKAIEVAIDKGMAIGVFTSVEGEKHIRDIFQFLPCVYFVPINSTSTARIQEMHLIMIHIICAILDTQFTHE